MAYLAKHLGKTAVVTIHSFTTSNLKVCEGKEDTVFFQKNIPCMICLQVQKWKFGMKAF